MRKIYPKLFRGLSYEDGIQLEEVLEFAFKHLSGIIRRSGENYAEHGLNVSATLSEITGDVSLLKAAVLHDFFLHKDAEILIKKAPMTEDEITLARDMHELRGLIIDSRTKDLDKVINSFIHDERLFPLRMAHRLSDVRRLQKFNLRFRKQIAKETLHMYTAIASRLGMHSWRYEMEDICFKELHPTIAADLEQKFLKLKAIDHSCLRQTQVFLSKKLSEGNIKCCIDGRIKSLYSTYRKMVIKNREFEELTDRLALRIIVDDAMDCYRVLGVVHAFMHPIPGKLKDYIGAPKENSYQSIHTVVYPLAGVTEQPIEIQIRTHVMDDICENGPAAHGDYKHHRYAVTTSLGKVSLFKNLAHLRQQAPSPRQFEKTLRHYFNGDQIVVFDRDDNLYHLKKPATVLDFVVHAFPAKCRRTKEVRINGRKTTLDAPLKDGDVVSARFGRKLMVDQHWVNYCKHELTRFKFVPKNNKKILVGVKKRR